MARRLTAAVLLLALFTACTTPRVVRLDMGQGAPLEYRPPTSNKSVKVDAAAFEEALTRLVLEAPLALRPAQQAWLVRASYPGNDEDTRWKRLMSKSFGGLCKPGQRRDDCLSLLDDAMGLSQWDKLGVALGLSIEPLKESISQAVENTLAPQLFYTVIARGSGDDAGGSCRAVRSKRSCPDRCHLAGRCQDREQARQEVRCRV